MTTILTLDYETFYDPANKYSLTGMDPEAYIIDKRFYVNGCAVKIDDEPSVFMTRAELRRFYRSVDWNDAVVLSHNALFDMAILAWVEGIRPALYVDTMGIANAYIRPYTGYSRLDACARYLKLPLKSGALTQVKGMHDYEIIQYPGLWEAYAAYACQDADNCYAIYKTYYPQMSRIERIKLDWTVRNYVKPKLIVEPSVLHENAIAVQEERDRLAAETGIDPKSFSSTAKFAAELEKMGIDVEYKKGAKDDIPAVAKKDPFMRELLAHSDPAVVSMAKARIAFASSIELTRTDRLLRLHATTHGRLLTPYTYSAAHTGRPGGTHGLNLTNMGRDSKLRAAIRTAKGFSIVTADASQIEARIIAVLSGCEPLSSAFREGRDVYSEFISDVVGYPVTKASHPILRQSGKVCVLAAQYGVSGPTMLNRLQNDGIAATLDDANRYVAGYRHLYPEVLKHGNEVVKILKWLVDHPDCTEEWRWGIKLTSRGIQLPSGRWIFYPEMCMRPNEKWPGMGLFYWSPRYNSWQSLYAGSINENLAQALANDHVSETHVKRPNVTVMHNYDALSLVVPDEEAEETKEWLIKSLSTPPWWAPDLPLAAEGWVADTFAGE